MEKKFNVDNVWQEIASESEEGHNTIATAKMTSRLIRALISAREEKGWTQRKFAEISGIKQSAIARIENLQVFPKINTIAKIAYYLELDLRLLNIEETEIADAACNFEKVILTKVESTIFNYKLYNYKTSKREARYNLQDNIVPSITLNDQKCWS